VPVFDIVSPLISIRRLQSAGGDSVPGLDAPFTTSSAPRFAGSHYAFAGQTGFIGNAVNPRHTALFVGRSLTYDAVLLDTDSAPGASGTQFGLTQTGFPPTAFTQLSVAGVIAFTGELIGSVVNSTLSDTLNQRGIWSTAEGPLTLEMRASDPAPDFGANFRFSLPGPVALNDIAFWAAVKRGSFPSTETKFALFGSEALMKGNL
jgi:hypothetical protein